MGEWKSFWFFILAMSIVTLVASLSGLHLISFFGISYILGVSTRIASKMSAFGVSLLTFCAFILGLVNLPLALLYAATIYFVSFFVIPFKGNDNLAWLLTVTTALFCAVLIIPFISFFFGNLLIAHFFWFFVVLYILTPAALFVFSRATFFQFLFTWFIPFPLRLLLNFVMIWLFGKFLISYLGLTGWEIGSLGQIIS